MKKGIFIILFITIITTILLSGCNASVKNDSSLKDDLTSYLEYHLVDGSTIKNLSIIKRLTDEKNKTDTVYVKISIEHESATAIEAYVMNYTLYNEGWLLDSITEYYGNEVEWSVIPKNPPSNEFIMNQLITYSNSMIDMFYSEQTTSDELKHTYFYEDGKYTTVIHSENIDDNNVFTCTVNTTRHFNYMDVNEEQILEFYFDTTSYEWWIANGSIVNTEITPKLHGKTSNEGKWLIPINGAIVEIDNPDSISGKDAYLTYDITCTINDEEYKSYFKLGAPTSYSIPWNFVSFGSMFWDPINISIYITPDILFCRDWTYNYECELEPITD